MLGLQGLAGALVFFSMIPNLYADPEIDPWYFSAEEMEVAYRYQEKFGERPSNPVRGRDCLLGKQEFTASYRGRAFSVSCRFIHETIRHLREMLEQGAAKYLFALDAGHAHLLVHSDVWEKKYSKLSVDEALPAILEEPSLAALYHTAEHLATTDPKTGKTNLETKAWKEKRNVVGSYDGRAIEILPPHPKESGIGPPKRYEMFAVFDFAANPEGQLFIFLGGKAVTFDITFDIGTGDEQLPNQSLARKPRD